MRTATCREAVRDQCFSYLSRCAIRGEQGAIETIKRLEREAPPSVPRVLDPEELERHPNDDLPF